jgi:hypothetical protein
MESDHRHACVRGGPNQPLHRDPQWSIVLTDTHRNGEDRNKHVHGWFSVQHTNQGFSDLTKWVSRYDSPWTIPSGMLSEAFFKCTGENASRG